MPTLGAFAFLFLVLSLGPSVSAQSAPNPASPTPGLCDVLKAPRTWDGKKLSLRGTVTLEFENFTLHDPKCDDWPHLWLMFGGDVSTPTKSTWNDTDRPAGKDIKVNGIPFPIIKDAQLEQFRSSITARSGKKPIYRVTATLAGMFLAGHASKDLPNFPGYGHMGCCYLFVIQQVLSVEKQPLTKEAEKSSAH